MAFVYNSYVLRVCLPNFEHDSSSPSLKIQCQRHTRTWTGIPICRSTQPLLLTTNPTAIPPTSTIITSATTAPIVLCHAEDVPTVFNATIVVEDVKETFPVGTTLNYTCLSGLETASSFTVCLPNGTWSTDALNLSMCQTTETTSSDTWQQSTTSEETSTLSSFTTERGNATVDFDESLPVLNFSAEHLESTPRPIVTADRHPRHIRLYCDRLPIIEHADLLLDQTVQFQSDNQTKYQGFLVYQCQHGFYSEIYKNEPVRVMCQYGEFHPILQCSGMQRISLSIRITNAV